jgi:hypothetical protein
MGSTTTSCCIGAWDQRSLLDFFVDPSGQCSEHEEGPYHAPATETTCILWMQVHMRRKQGEHVCFSEHPEMISRVRCRIPATCTLESHGTACLRSRCSCVLLRYMSITSFDRSLEPKRHSMVDVSSNSLSCNADAQSITVVHIASQCN